ncbi:MAG: metallophosphoesterase [Verrucomicrobiales bacterium]|nr:metallophosphoesterase [Verrucomicrobiales bacterium]
MIDPNKKSTGHSPSPASAAVAEIGHGLILDGRLALVDPAARWLAVADLHFGYEANRRREGGLWPMWGMETIAARLEGLVRDWQPETLILVGDVVDGSAAPDEAITWLTHVHTLASRIVLITGNHDRGPIRREFQWIDDWRHGDVFFEHGHLTRPAPDRGSRVRGHVHPSVNFNDGSGTRLRLPSLVIEEAPEACREIFLPAFSPWAGGTRHTPTAPATVRQWACSPRRVFEYFD